MEGAAVEPVAEATVSAEELLAHHEAAHAVAMYRLGFGVRFLTLNRVDDFTGLCRPRRAPQFGDHLTAEGRLEIEQYLLALHAGNAAERHLVPDRPDRRALYDHTNVHLMLQWIEDDTAVEFAWCSYLWQRSYAFITDPRQWRFVQKVARSLMDGPRTLGTTDVVRLLDATAAEVERDRTLPDFQLLGQPPVNVRSPWHARWYSGEDKQPFPRIELSFLAGLQLEPLRRPEQDATGHFPGLDVFSPYAAHVLQRYGIRGLRDLATWSRKRLASLRGVGPKTLREIAEVTARFGITLVDERHAPAHRTRSDGVGTAEERT
jgi:hypothetical protein